MPTLCFEGRGWGKALCDYGKPSPGRMAKENIVLHLSDNAYVKDDGDVGDSKMPLQSR